MRYGIDIYNGQSDIKLSNVTGSGVTFVIVKATEGQGLVDKSCDRFIEQAKALGLPWGFYHYARNNNGKHDADYFYRNTKNYFGRGIPVLDFEDPDLLNSGKAIAYAEDFCSYIYAKSGIYPMIYCSASVCKMFKGSWIPDKCALWMAGYPRTYTQFVDVDIPYSIAPWKSCAIWQFSGQGRIAGYNGKVDLDRAYITREQWNALATGKQIESKTKDLNIKAACRVILGEYGNGTARKEALMREGFDYSTVQGYVNKILEACE